MMPDQHGPAVRVEGLTFSYGAGEVLHHGISGRRA